MKIKSVLQKSIAVLVLAVVVLMAACSQTTEPEAPAEGESPSEEVMVMDGEALLQDRCTECHNLERTTSKNKDEAGWTETVDRMVQKGASLNSEEQALVIEYLVENYGPVTE